MRMRVCSTTICRETDSDEHSSHFSEWVRARKRKKFNQIFSRSFIKSMLKFDNSPHMISNNVSQDCDSDSVINLNGQRHIHLDGKTKCHRQRNIYVIFFPRLIHSLINWTWDLIRDDVDGHQNIGAIGNVLKCNAISFGSKTPSSVWQINVFNQTFWVRNDHSINYGRVIYML